MNYNYTLKYRTFDSLLDDVRLDLYTLSLEGKVDPAQLLKVAMRVNYDLGLRIYTTKEVVLEIEKNKAKLPDDFFVMNFATLCGEMTTTYATPQGTNIQQIDYVPQYKEFPATINICSNPTVNCSKCNTTVCGCANASCLAPRVCSCTMPAPVYNPAEPQGDTCIKPRLVVNCKQGEAYELVQVINTETRVWRHFFPIKFRNSMFMDCDCPNVNMAAADEAWIKDGFVHTTMECGHLYINYQGMMEDDDGNLMVVDHPEMNEYYEYALKKRVFENLLMTGENVTAQLQYVQQELRGARNRALSIVNTPNFSEMQKVWLMNRKAQYSRYYDMFKSYFYNPTMRVNNVV